MKRLSFAVAMCTYNGASFLRKQLESIATQSRPPDELVICDDRSTDATVEIAYEFRCCAPFEVRLHVNDKNLGSTKNFEKAIGLCRGELIALADQDDIWCPSKLEEIASTFRSKPSVGVVFSDADVIDENQALLGYKLWDSVGFTKSRQRALSKGGGTQVLLNRNVVTGATMSFRAEFRDLVLPVPNIWVHDGWIALLVSAVADLDFIERPLIRYRRHATQQIGPLDSDIHEQVALSSRTGSSDYLALARAFALLKERLLAKVEYSRIQTVIPRIDEKIKHLEARARLASTTPCRLIHVLEELSSCRYHRYSQGWKSVARDLLPRE